VVVVVTETVGLWWWFTDGCDVVGFVVLMLRTWFAMEKKRTDCFVLFMPLLDFFYWHWSLNMPGNYNSFHSFLFLCTQLSMISVNTSCHLQQVDNLQHLSIYHT
jgi:hypothetical protein